MAVKVDKMDVMLDPRIKLKQIKVCPVVVRQMQTSLEILLFRHPLAGVQLVKGTVELSDSSIEQAALRELKEESGIDKVLTTEYLGEWQSDFQQQLWHFVLCNCANELPNSWRFYTQDDGGHEFEFFWFELAKEIDFSCHDVFARALDHLAKILIHMHCNLR